ncbi:MAG TPA: SagB/ThcOx family dehydrogenase [Gammaproteobacteria bacterium]|nr:SagB/ThcOx family dehydrogenase [Gammaproteobacteria bacterium]
MKFRRASTLAMSFEDGQVAIHNFLTKTSFSCSEQCLTFLADLDDWNTGEQLFAYFPDTDRNGVAAQITRLVALNALLVKGSPQAELDEKYRKSWQWGAVTGFYHFSSRNTRFLNGKAARLFIRKRKAMRPSPSLYKSNAGATKVVPLPATDVGIEPFATMRTRRSERKFLGEPVRLQALADCLFAGNGIVDFVVDKDFGRLPLTMTPSGGARNPYELYLYANRVEKLKPGFYHYSARSRDLGLIRPGRVDIQEMLAGQKWPTTAGAIIFLTAFFPRTMWKYHMPLAYRVVLMEAGFIGQNIALAATYHGMSAVPSGALDNGLVERYLGVPEVETAVVLSMSLGKASGN